ncbi:MAG: hypothetical protein M3Q16_05185, partial [Pseudomonadota bacterium]|nr:hypothetical protein [Pseudomonadota bacterium]
LLITKISAHDVTKQNLVTDNDSANLPWDETYHPPQTHLRHAKADGIEKVGTSNVDLSVAAGFSYASGLLASQLISGKPANFFSVYPQIQYRAPAQ